jgi:beta-mannosidase
LNQCHWKFKNVAENKWMPAKVPGTVHTDLLSNKIIPEPYYGNNEKSLQWIEEKDWEYQCYFNISKSEFFKNHIELELKGLDTYAGVYVNDSLVLTADNMFREWNIDVKKYVCKGKNKLKIVFYSAVKKGKEAAAKLRYTLPGDEKVFTRKAQYQYGWDWGPRFVTCGIWKDVGLVFWDDAKINHVKYVQNVLTDSVAHIEFVCTIESDKEVNRTILIREQKKFICKKVFMNTVFRLPYEIRNAGG